MLSIPSLAISHGSIRRATFADGPVLCELFGQLGYPAPEADFLRRLTAVLEDRTQVLLVAELQDSPVACIHLNRLTLLEADGYGQILALVVDEKHRSNGFGTKLVAAGEAWARSQGCLKLTVRSNVVRVRTHGFYERHGYARVKSQHTFTKPLSPASGP